MVPSSAIKQPKLKFFMRYSPVFSPRIPPTPPSHGVLRSAGMRGMGWRRYQTFAGIIKRRSRQWSYLLGLADRRHAVLTSPGPAYNPCMQDRTRPARVLKPGMGLTRTASVCPMTERIVDAAANGRSMGRIPAHRRRDLGMAAACHGHAGS